MKDLTGFILFSIGAFLVSGLGYILWFMPKNYLNYIQRRKKRFKSQFPFLPDWFVDYTFLDYKPDVILWWSRILVTISLVLCFLGVIVSIRGPF